MTAHLDVLRHDGRELADLLAPVSPAQFVQAYWDRRALFVEGSPAKLERLIGGPFDRAAFDATVRRLAEREGAVAASFVGKRFSADVFRAYFDHAEHLVAGRGPRPLLAVRPTQIDTVLAAGASALLNGVEHVPAVGALAESLRGALHYVGDVVVGSTLSPPGRRVAPHFDPGGAFILQTNGRKRYAYTALPVIELPQGKAYLYDDGRFRYTDDRGLGEGWEQPPQFDGCYEEVVMGPGDLLYLPPGVVHHTEAVEGEYIALLLTFIPVNFRQLCSALLDGWFDHQPDWRRLPVWVDEDDGRLPDAARSFAAARLSELRAALDASLHESRELSRLWHRLPVSADQWTPPEGGAVTIGPDDRLRVRPGAPIGRAWGADREGHIGLQVFVGRRELEVDEGWGKFLERALAAGPFVARSALAWAPDASADAWQDVQACLSTLVEQGLLERDTP